MSVVVGYTPSPQGEAALAAALRASESFGRPLVVVSHAYADAQHGRVVAGATDVETAIRQARAQNRADAAARGTPRGSTEHGSGQGAQRGHASALEAADAAPAEPRILTADDDDVAALLLRTLDEVEGTLLVIGLRRRSPSGKLNLGAAARRLVVSAPCPVLAVKNRRTSGAQAHR